MAGARRVLGLRRVLGPRRVLGLRRVLGARADLVDAAVPRRRCLERRAAALRPAIAATATATATAARLSGTRTRPGSAWSVRRTAR
jgi:hypothetical protein